MWRSRAKSCAHGSPSEGEVPPFGAGLSYGTEQDVAQHSPDRYNPENKDAHTISHGVTAGRGVEHFHFALTLAYLGNKMIS